MDSFHRRPQEQDTRTGHDCRFCKIADPEFGKRDPLDRLVYSELNNSATSHLTENGYVWHRMLEIRGRLLSTKSDPLRPVGAGRLNARLKRENIDGLLSGFVGPGRLTRFVDS